jgi:chaperonin cofactor prefoldin
MERAQLLHDATLRRHGEMLDRHAETMAQLSAIAERQQQLQAQLRDILRAIRDMLERGDGH